jgi:hypothetical protein
MKLKLILIAGVQFIAALLIAICITSHVEAEDSTSQQTASDDPWSKTYVFQFDHDTFYIPAVWAGFAEKTVPNFDPYQKYPDGSTFKVNNYFIIGPMGTGMDIDFRDMAFEEVLTLKAKRLVAGKILRVDQLLLHHNFVAPTQKSNCPATSWEIVRSHRFFMSDNCEITCVAGDFGKKFIPGGPTGSSCRVVRKTYLGHTVEYDWDGFNVDPATWEDQDRRVEQLLDWLKTKPNQRPKFLPDLPPKDKP